MTMVPRLLRPRHVLQASLSIALAGPLALAPLAHARADAPTTGKELRTFLTLTPAESTAEPTGAIEDEAFSSTPEGPENAEALPREHRPPDPGPAPRKGLGMLITGATITGLYGLPVTIWGTVIIASTRQQDDFVGDLGGVIGGFVLFFGVVGLAVGVPLLGVGGARYSRWRIWKDAQDARLSASVTRSPYGTYSPGLTLRF